MSHTLYEAAVVRVQRCELAVPGSNPGMFEKAMKSGADFVFLDLEDAVAPVTNFRHAGMLFKPSTTWTGELTV
jgi:hypothetical protein